MKLLIVRRLLLPVLLLVGVFINVSHVDGAPEAGTITIDPTTTYQTISGWQAVAQIGNDAPNLQLFRDPLIELAANDLGINRIIIELRSIHESPNDNNDPFLIEWSGFDFSEVDFQIKEIVVPLRQRLATGGESLHVNIKYHQGGSPTFHSDDTEEYAELIEATFLHMQSEYGWVPDSVSVVNEPNSSKGWSATQIGNAILATANRLETHGYTPIFVAPERVNVQSSVSWFDELVTNVPSALQYLGEISYHCYGGCDVDQNLTDIASRAVQHNINSSQLEKIGHNYEDLHRDLKLARVSAWQQFALAFYQDTDNGAQYYLIDNSDLSNPVVNIGQRTKFLRQYFKFIRSGAQRIEATSTDNNFDPMAFINTGGDYVVVVKADQGGEINIQGLPAGDYGIKYTTSDDYDVDLPDVTLVSGQTLTANIPNKGVITVYLKIPSSPTPPESVTISGPTTGFVGISSAFTATVSPNITSQPITYIWEAGGQSSITHKGGLSDTVTFTWNSTGARNITVTASNLLGEVSDTHNFNVVIAKKHYLPLISAPAQIPSVLIDKTKCIP